MHNLRREFNDYFSVLLRFLFFFFPVPERETRRFFYANQSSSDSSRVEILFFFSSVGNLGRDKRRLSDVLI